MTDSILNRQVVLARRPSGNPEYEDFQVSESTLPAVAEGQFATRNLYLSLDAGFRNWMNETSEDNILPAFELGAPVMGLAFSRVIESRHPDYAVGDLLMARLAWEEYSVSDGGEFIVKLPSDLEFPYSYYLGILGDTGMSAYFGLVDIGRPKEGETVLISAAGGAVGSVAGQIAKILGARTVGITSSESKCRRLMDELGYDAAVNRKSADGIESAIAAACPAGIDVYLDSVGGETLQAAIANLNHNLFELVTKEALMQGFMTHHRVDRYPEAREQLARWIADGKLNNIEYMLEGIENAGVAFCDLFAGRNFGKTVVKLSDD
jgi:NADPH-dependent curcumin reductase CurA